MKAQLNASSRVKKPHRVTMARRVLALLSPLLSVTICSVARFRLSRSVRSRRICLVEGVV
jgi:hypothetical protein